MSRVAVLKGGRSLERGVSLRSGARVEDALARLGHEVLPVDAGHDLVERLRALRPDVAFIALHGPYGEDGTVQELLEAIGIPYTSSGVSACIRCSDKVLAKHELRDAGTLELRSTNPLPALITAVHRDWTEAFTLQLQRENYPAAQYLLEMQDSGILADDALGDDARSGYTTALERSRAAISFA